MRDWRTPEDCTVESARRIVALENGMVDAVRVAHGSRKYAKALRTVEQILLRALGYNTFAEFVRWNGDGRR